MSELRFTETNSADDSAGKTWGLEGSLFWFLTGGVFAAVILLLVLFSMLHWTFVTFAAVKSRQLLKSRRECPIRRLQEEPRCSRF